MKRSKGPAAASSGGTKRAAAKQATPAKTSSPEEAELREEEMPKKRRRKMSDEEGKAAQPRTVEYSCYQVVSGYRVFLQFLVFFSPQELIILVQFGRNKACRRFLRWP